MGEDMTKKQIEKHLGILIAETYHGLHGKDRVKDFVADPAIRARLQGQWAILHTVCTCLKLNMTSVRASMAEKLKELAA